VKLLLGDSMIVDVIPVDGGEYSVELVEVKKTLVRRSIEQLGFIKDVNSLVVLSG
jgi:Vam6/Vps39-like protein vacuolar protein sorting-associated protein 39